MSDHNPDRVDTLFVIASQLTRIANALEKQTELDILRIDWYIGNGGAIARDFLRLQYPKVWEEITGRHKKEDD